MTTDGTDWFGTVGPFNLQSQSDTNIDVVVNAVDARGGVATVFSTTVVLNACFIIG
jgi:hypothetical protein